MYVTFVLKKPTKTLFMAKTTITPIGQWNTFHDNGPYPTRLLLDTALEKKSVLPQPMDRYRDAALEIQRLLQDTLDHNERFRAFGSGWSLNDIAHQQDRMHFNARMNLKWSIAVSDLHQKSTLDAGNLFFFQCGNIIKEASAFLHQYGKSFKTTGASNGQTIGGAVSTGIHGSSLDVGAFQDAVRGINLIIGPGPHDNVYIEKHTQPVLSDTHIANLGARVIRNDGLFLAALVGLGGFGFIHGVVIETEPLFLLKRYTRHIKRPAALQLAHSLDFSDPAVFSIPGEMDAAGTCNRPFHYMIYVNPYNKKEDYITEVMYKKPYRTGYPDPIPRISNAVYKDLPDWMAAFAAKHNKLIPLIMKAMTGTIFPTLDDEAEGTLPEIFWDSQHAGPAFCISMGIDHRDAGAALDLFIQVVNKYGPVPGAIGMRFVRSTEATLGFTRFPFTCMLEMDGILWTGNPQMISLPDLEARLWEAMRKEGIPFTMHWGKNSAWHVPGLIDYMYGNKDDEWKEYRSALLGKQMADVFSNNFLQRCRLAEFRTHTASKLTESILV
jgi:hypothetical protein